MYCIIYYQRVGLRRRPFKTTVHVDYLTLLSLYMYFTLQIQFDGKKFMMGTYLLVMNMQRLALVMICLSLLELKQQDH